MDTTQEDLTALYHRWMQAIKDKDLSTLQPILAEEYTYTASGQGRFSRRQWLDAVAVYDIETFSFPSIEARRYGEVAVAIIRCVSEGVYRGELRSGDFLITDVWVNRDGRWQVVARSSILNPP
ncbi:MAG: nuclear transport factor 2 family protein [Thermomicrobia bacterium]|nr:nuclear transport factor 2 family protein [Thermomicrobia bacterium]